MERQELLFYNEYEKFYTMSKSSEVFPKFCKKAFGEDFSQDGFSDVQQIDRILEYLPNSYSGYRVWKWKDGRLFTTKNGSIYTWV